jgi:hypothetical protein
MQIAKVAFEACLYALHCCEQVNLRCQLLHVWIFNANFLPY